MIKPQAHELQVLHAEICAAMADPTRIAIIYELADGPRNVGEIVAALGLNQTSVSRHLRFLRDRGMVSTDRQGQNVYYALVDARVIEALDLMRSVLADVLSHRQALVQGSGFRDQGSVTNPTSNLVP
jgi:DNA-binding transcriptional ArsR family regulator